MAADSPASVIVNGVDGTEVAVVRGAAVPALTRPLLVAGIDPGGAAQALLVSTTGSLVPQPTASAVSTVSRSAGTVTIAAANPARKGFLLQNDIDRGRMFVKLGAGATTADFSVELLPKAVLELPFPVYVGIVTATWDAAGSGQARVTEMT